MSWQTIKSQTILKNKFFTLKKSRCRKTDRTVVEEYYCVERPNVVVIASFTAKMELVLIYQYRYPVKAWDFELPAGYLEPKEKNALKAAKREFLEETGFTAKKFKKIKNAYASAGFMNNTVHFFIGFNAKKVQAQKLDKSEEIKVKIVPWSKALKLLKDGKIKDLGSVAGILLAKEYLEKNI